jgi:hypothetical protein
VRPNNPLHLTPGVGGGVGVDAGVHPPKVSGSVRLHSGMTPHARDSRR